MLLLMQCKLNSERGQIMNNLSGLKGFNAVFGLRYVTLLKVLAVTHTVLGYKCIQVNRLMFI